MSDKHHPNVLRFARLEVRGAKRARGPRPTGRALVIPARVAVGRDSSRATQAARSRRTGGAD